MTFSVTANYNYSSLILNDTPIGYWRLDETSGTTAHDSSVSAYNGTIGNGAVTFPQQGVTGDGDAAMKFWYPSVNGTKGNVVLPSIPANLLKNGMTFEAWVYPTKDTRSLITTGSYEQSATRLAPTFNTSLILYHIVGTFPNIGLVLTMNGGGSAFLVEGWLNGNSNAYNTVPFNTWTHIAAVYTGNGSASRTIYVNGVAAGTDTTGTAADFTSAMRIGEDERWGGYDTVPLAVIDEVAIYAYALTPLQIASHYAIGPYASKDLTPYVIHSSVTEKLNTVDFSLADVPLDLLRLKQAVSLTDPSWTGNIAAIATSDPTNRIGHTVATVTGTNTKTLPADTAPFDLSESPTNATFHYLLENGSGVLLLEDGTDFAPGDYLTEGDLSYGYDSLSVRTQVNTTGPITTLGRARVYQPGLRPGNEFKLTSSNQSYSSSPFQITQVTITWPAKTTNPFYDIEFGDTPETLATWTQISAPPPTPPVAAPVVVPPTLTIYGKCSAGAKLWPMGGGIVTIASASFSVATASGHTSTVQLVGQIQGFAYAWDNYIATPRRAVRATISGGIYTGAWQEFAASTYTNQTFDLSSSPGISLPDGTYTVSIQIDSQESNQIQISSAWAQAAVTTT